MLQDFDIPDDHPLTRTTSSQHELFDRCTADSPIRGELVDLFADETYVYANNGHKGVRVPRGDVDDPPPPGDKYIETLQEKYSEALSRPFVEVSFEDMIDVLLGVPTRPLPKTEECDVCRGRGVHECFECGHEHDCDECGGSGELELDRTDRLTFDVTGVRFLGRPFSPELLIVLVSALRTAEARTMHVYPAAPDRGETPPLVATVENIDLIIMPMIEGHGEHHTPETLAESPIATA